MSETKRQKVRNNVGLIMPYLNVLARRKNPTISQRQTIAKIAGIVRDIGDQLKAKGDGADFTKISDLGESIYDHLSEIEIPAFARYVANAKIYAERIADLEVHEEAKQSDDTDDQSEVPVEPPRPRVPTPKKQDQPVYGYDQHAEKLGTLDHTQQSRFWFHHSRNVLQGLDFEAFQMGYGNAITSIMNDIREQIRLINKVGGSYSTDAIVSVAKDVAIRMTELVSQIQVRFPHANAAFIDQINLAKKYALKVIDLYDMP